MIAPIIFEFSVHGAFNAIVAAIHIRSSYIKDFAWGKSKSHMRCLCLSETYNVL